MTEPVGGTAVVTLPTDTSILVTRWFAAPPHLVYRCYTEPDLVRRWWGGGEGEVTVAAMDLHVGGGWRFVVAGDDYEVGFHGVYRQIVLGARIVCTEVDEGAPDAEANAALCTYTFLPAGAGTTVGLLTQMPTREGRDGILDSGVEKGIQASWDLLEQVALSLR
jgi:uncharacterized protein YndB with AHSA1/START domain